MYIKYTQTYTYVHTYILYRYLIFIIQNIEKHKTFYKVPILKI